MGIKNVSRRKVDQKIKEVRNAIEHRATWLYYLLDEAEKSGADWEKIGRKAVFRCGCLHGDQVFTRTGDLKKFGDEFGNASDMEIFEIDVKEHSDDRFYVEFHYCPLVSAWLKLTDDEEKIAKLCEIAMEGDRAIVSRMTGFEFNLGDTIAKGGKVCCIEVVKESR